MLALTACGGDKAKTPEQLIVGTWVSTAPIVVEESGMTISITDMAVTYKKDNTTKFNADMAMSGLMAMELSFSGTGTWAMEGDQLTETITAVDVDMKTEVPGMPDMNDMMSEQMIAEGKTTSTIVSLDKKTYVVKDNDSGETMTLKRK